MNAPSPIRRPVRHFARTFLAGLLAALPLVATVGVFAWLAQLLYGWLGPQSLIGGLFVRLGLGLSESEGAGDGLGVLFIVGAIYALGLLGQRDEEGLKSMSAVWVTFGSEGGVKVLALLSTPEPVMIGGRPYMAVIVPTAPVPIGGGLLYVPQASVVPADVGMDAVTSIYVSMGVTSAQHLSSRPADKADTTR